MYDNHCHWVTTQLQLINIIIILIIITGISAYYYNQNFGR